jgi:hypothetical protein
LAPYLVIKISWVVGAVLGLVPVGAGFSLGGWVLLNLVTVGMAGIGIALALALVRPWGMRIPGWLVVFCAWVGAGFLVSLLPYVGLEWLFGSGAGGAEEGASGGPVRPAWEGVLLEVSFVGMGLGLAVSVPAYLRRRWPTAFTGRGAGAGSGTGRSGVRGAVPISAALPAVVAAVVGTVWLYWAVGGTVGLAHPEVRITEWHLLTGLGAAWALAGAAVVRTVVRARGSRVPRWLPSALVWLGSGSLFAWNAWKLPYVVYVLLAEPPGFTLPENLVLAAALHLAAVLAGAGMLRMLVVVNGARRR